MFETLEQYATPLEMTLLMLICACCCCCLCPNIIPDCSDSNYHTDRRVAPAHPYEVEMTSSSAGAVDENEVIDPQETVIRVRAIRPKELIIPKVRAILPKKLIIPRVARNEEEKSPGSPSKTSSVKLPDLNFKDGKVVDYSRHS